MFSCTGIDNTVCTHGGLLSYQHSQGARPLKAPAQLKILLVHTDVSRNTRALVDKVRAKLCLMPKVRMGMFFTTFWQYLQRLILQVVSRILDAMDQISHQCLDTLERLRAAEDGNEGQDEQGKEEMFQTLEVRRVDLTYLIHLLW